jgi:hypothetical protein
VSADMLDIPVDDADLYWDFDLRKKRKEEVEISTYLLGIEPFIVFFKVK